MTWWQYTILALIGGLLSLFVAVCTGLILASRGKMQQWDDAAARKFAKKYDEDNEVWWR